MRPNETPSGSASDRSPIWPQADRAVAQRTSRAGAGGEPLAVKLYEVPVGQSLCPYHYEFEEEWLLLLDGELDLRVPTCEYKLAKGDLVRFAPGPEGAHKVTNRGDATARLLIEVASGGWPSGSLVSGL